ncbi:winged helix-turn-helix domain-containing protein [Fulvivirgaceae bacterium LMO-SS25]
MTFKKLDPLLHVPLRLAAMSILISEEEADFVTLKKRIEATAGNLSVQLDKLSQAGYIEVEKGFKGKMPHTSFKITDRGVTAFENYLDALRSYLPSKNN